ncbi:MAG: cytochrome c biogenesis protein CcdA, partial [bacterium]|nr:cytochrome c biogenesis protein CcdA [bacterium]
MKKKLLILVAFALLLVGLYLFFEYSGGGAELLWSLSDNGTVLLPLITIAALIDSVNPCAFSVLLVTIAFLFSIGRLRKNILKIGGAYILGIFVVYVLIGLGLLQALHLFNTPHFMAKVGAALLILLGLINIINELFPAFPIKLRIPGGTHDKMAKLMDRASIPTAFILGGIVGLCEFPCSGGPYLLVIGLLNDSATYLSGVGYLAIYNVVFVLPLVIILLLSSNKLVVGKVQKWQAEKKHLMRWVGGLLMLTLGALI